LLSKQGPLPISAKRLSDKKRSGRRFLCQQGHHQGQQELGRCSVHEIKFYQERKRQIRQQPFWKQDSSANTVMGDESRPCF